MPTLCYNANMFTGLVQAVGSIVETRPTTAGRRLVIALQGLAHRAIKLGDSIAVSGVCLTVVQYDGATAGFDVVRQTLRATTLGHKQPGDAVNLECSLKAGDELGGHFVQGHIDTITTVKHVQSQPDDWRITFSLPTASAPLIVPRGSVALDGVSMTIAEVTAQTFTVAVIPTTRENTTLSSLEPGDQVNIETDILVRSIRHYLDIISPGRRCNAPTDSTVNA